MLKSKTLSRLLTVSLVAGVLGFGTVQQAFAEKTISLSTGTVQLSLAQGGVAKDSIMVSNRGDEPIKAMVYASDILHKQSGEPIYKKPTGDVANILKSPASWLTLRLPKDTQVIANTPYIELDPGEQVKLDFEMRVPTDATPGDFNAAIFFEMFDTATGQAGAQSKVAGRIGARIVVRVAGDVIEKLDLAPYKVRGFVIGDAVPYSFTLKNQGNVDKRIQPNLVILDTSEAEKMRSQIETYAVLYAGDTRQYSGVLKLKNAAFGEYTMRAEIGYERDSDSNQAIAETVTKDRSIFVIPTWFAVLAVLVLASPILWFTWRPRRRRAKANAQIAGDGDTATGADTAGEGAE